MYLLTYMWLHKPASRIGFIMASGGAYICTYVSIHVCSHLALREYVHKLTCVVRNTLALQALHATRKFLFCSLLYTVLWSWWRIQTKWQNNTLFGTATYVSIYSCATLALCSTLACLSTNMVTTSWRPWKQASVSAVFRLVSIYRWEDNPHTTIYIQWVIVKRLIIKHTTVNTLNRISLLLPHPCT